MNEPILRAVIDGRRKVHARGGLHYIKGNTLPYFSLTIASWELRDGLIREDTFGCAHDELVALWPELKPLADLHGSFIDGTPLHAEAKGWYWLAGALGGLGERYHGSGGSPQKTTDECREILRRHLRIDEAEVSQLMAETLVTFQQSGPKVAREVFASYVESQKPRWKREAEDCIEALGLTVYGDPWHPADKEAA